MDRTQKKCLVGSMLFHGFLLLLIVFGSAFFVAKEKPLNLPAIKINAIPTILLDQALAGGGGNPNLPRTDDQQKGQTLLPQPAPAPPPPAPKPQSKPAQPEPQPEPPPQPVKEVKKPAEQAKPPVIKPNPLTKVEPKPKETTPPKDDILSQLTPVKRTTVDKEKAKREAEKAKREAEERAAAREAERQAAEQARQARVAQERFAKAVGQATSSLQRGFSSGTKVEIGGPGGEAYASYDAFVQAAYYDAWQVQSDVSDEDSVVRVKVTIARDGRIVDSRIVGRSSSSIVDRTVQRALDKVRRDGLRPFPEGATESERTYNINFNLKAKRLSG